MKYFPEFVTPSHANCKLLMTKLRTRKMGAIALVSFTISTTICLTGCYTNPAVEQDTGWIPSKGAVLGMAFGVGGGVVAVAILATSQSPHRQGMHPERTERP